MSKHAALTIISKNYYSFAATLAESYLRHHPDHDFIIVLADRIDGHCSTRLECGAELLEMEQLRIPDPARFIYRYSIMELNTAVKPFAMKALFELRGYDTLLYIDPDIYVFTPMSAIYTALESASIVLIPHTRRPYYDESHPADINILQSGAYNLGFIGLRNTRNAHSMLEWWMSKLYRDCVVDIPNGLFVDQKWMDMVPGFYPDTAIVHDIGYNVAYWNLHERRVQRENDRWFVSQVPLCFFHFSGFSPFSPQVLSKHQSRHDLRSEPALRALTDFYAARLFANGHAETSSWPYAFERLQNGVKMPLGLVRDIMQWAIRNKVPTPDPLDAPDEFCRFLLSRAAIPTAPDDVLLYHYLLRRRADLVTAFQGVNRNHDQPDFRRWLKNSGGEEGITDELLAFESEDAISDHVLDAFTRFRKATRTDIFEYFSSMLDSTEDFHTFCDWFTIHGPTDMGFEPHYTEHFKRAGGGLTRILNIYFLRGDLHQAFPTLYTRRDIESFGAWLRAHRYQLELGNEEISLFVEFADVRKQLIEKLRFLYQHFGRVGSIAPSIYSIDTIRYMKHIALDTRAVAKWLASEPAIEPVDHFTAQFGNDPAALDDPRAQTIPFIDARTDYAIQVRVRRHFEGRGKAEELVNLAGYFAAPSGMGEFSRSMLATLKHAGVAVRPVDIPHPFAQSNEIPTNPAHFGWPSGRASMSITVANADSRALVDCVLPTHFWAPRNVGSWIWETEELPPRFRDSQRSFDEIWTPSKHSADAIRKCVQIPVHVLPLVLDVEDLDRATVQRERFGLPGKSLLFGFAFDPASVIERKNVAGVIQAFLRAFAHDDDCWLVLKVNGRSVTSYEYELAMRLARHDRIIVIKDTMTRADTLSFIRSLDAYVSLHRSEGFGLTCAEAMAMGVPTIATGYSANLEFMNERNSLLVPTRVIETERPYGPYPAGTRWGDPDLDAAASMMRSLLDADLRATLGAEGARSVRETLSVESIAVKAMQLMRGNVPASDAPRSQHAQPAGRRG